MARMEKKPSKPVDLTIRLLEQIRDQVTSTNARFDALDARIDQLDAKLTDRGDRLDAAMQELAEQQRFIVRGMRALTERDRRFEKELATLRARLPT
jgi:predicted transcriptional regulator